MKLLQLASINLDDVLDIARRGDAPVLKEDAAVAPDLKQIKIVRGQHQDAGAANPVLEPLLSLRQEMCVAGGNPFVHQQYLGRDAGRNREGEPKHHAGGIGPDRHVDVMAEFGELGDLVGARPHLARMYIPHKTMFSRPVASGLSPTDTSSIDVTRPKA